MHEFERKRAILYLAWKERFLNEAMESAKTAKLLNTPIILITDVDTAELVPDDSPFDIINVVSLKYDSYLNKCHLWNYLPEGFDSFLFLDSDTRVLMDVTFGFHKAELFGVAASPAPHYSLDHFWGFDNIMDKVGVKCQGQLQYNTGVIFFIRRRDVYEVFKKWEYLAKTGSEIKYYNDQPFFTLAMELLDFNPYTLSPSYNYRAFSELISGSVRIWHNHESPPKGINIFDRSWPPRRYRGNVLEPY